MILTKKEAEAVDACMGRLNEHSMSIEMGHSDGTCVRVAWGTMSGVAVTRIGAKYSESDQEFYVGRRGFQEAYGLTIRED